MADRVVLFIDAQNVYRGARETFCERGAFHTDGQIDPLKIGELICSRPPEGHERVLHQVRVYTGRPDSTKQPKAYAAHMRQCAQWERAGVSVIPRSLRYPWDYPDSRAEEKGIDVALSIDFAMGAIDGAYDVGIIFSTDTDLRPALEVVANRFPEYPRAETAAWKGNGANRRLSIAGPKRIWCHMLHRADYEAVHDSTDYNVG